MFPKVSIIIPFYNCQYINFAIDSALNQTYTNTEVIVINDGSNRYQEKITPYFDRITYVEKSNGGTASALNAGILASSGEYISWLSSDDLFVPEKVAKQVEFMIKNNSPISYGNYHIINEDGMITKESVGMYFPKKQDFYRHFQRGCHINGCTVMMKREVIDKVGLFNETYRYTQDYEYWLRALQHYMIDYISEPLVHYRIHHHMGSKKYNNQQREEIKELIDKYKVKLQNLILQNSKPLKFIFPILTLSKGGAQRMLAEITNGLVDKVHDVTILMPKQGEVEFDIRAKLIKTNATVLQEKDYPVGDVIVSNFYLTVPTARQASLNGKGMHVRFSLCYEPMFLEDQYKTFPTYNATKNLIVLSNYQQQLIELNHGIKGEIVPVGVSPEFYNFRVREQQSQLNVSAVVRLPEGGYSWQRNQDYLIQTLEILKQKMPHIKINLICPPNELSKSKSLQELIKKQLFTFLTPKDDRELAYYYNEADIFVSTSIFEAAALPALEAMKCGAAIVTIYSGGNLDYTRHEENCLLSYGFENKLLSDIISLIQDEAFRKKLAQKGEEEASKWTWKRSVNLFEEKIYDFYKRG